MWNYGIFEDNYEEHYNGYMTVIFTYGANNVINNTSIMSNAAFAYPYMVSRDGNGIADYNVSFESELADHTTSEFSNGVEIGVISRDPYDGWGAFALYPASPSQDMYIIVEMEPNFTAGVTNPSNF